MTDLFYLDQPMGASRTHTTDWFGLRVLLTCVRLRRLRSRSLRQVLSPQWASSLWQTSLNGSPPSSTHSRRCATRHLDHGVLLSRNSKSPLSPMVAPKSPQTSHLRSRSSLPNPSSSSSSSPTSTLTLVSFLRTQYDAPQLASSSRRSTALSNQPGTRPNAKDGRTRTSTLSRPFRHYCRSPVSRLASGRSQTHL